MLLFLPRRGLLEVWSPDLKAKVTEFPVSQQGTLLRAEPAGLDDGIPRRRDLVAAHAAFLQPDGQLLLFHIPFHALTASSSAEKDFQVAGRVRDQLNNTTAELELEELAGQLAELRSPQLRSHVLVEVLGAGRLLPLQAAELLQLLRPAQPPDQQQAELRLFSSRLDKLHRLCKLQVGAVIVTY